MTTLRRPDGLVVALRPLDPAAPWIAAWRDLSRRVLVDNLFYEADYALAAAGAFGSGVQVLLVGDRAPEEPGLRLVALWPCRRSRTRWGLPIPVTIGWMHPFGVFGAPLLDARAAPCALDALLDAACALLSVHVMLTHVPTDGPFAALLDAVRPEARRAVFWPHARAYLDLSGLDFSQRSQYLEHLSGRRRRKLRQSAERLAEGGPLAFETIRDPESLGRALSDYVALESAGWKGRAGTAIAPAESVFLAGAVAALGESGRVRIDRLARNGTTLASSITFTTRDKVWCLKLSFDEDEARHSPGAQLLHRLTQSLLADSGVAAADSCAPPDFRLAETFWAERRALAHVLIAPPGTRLFPLAARLERLRAQASRSWQARKRRVPAED